MLFALAAPGFQADAAAAPESGGARRVEIRGEWLYVDGEPFLVKGIGYSPYRPGQVPWKDTVDPAVMERDFERIAAAGFNTLRTWAPLGDEALALAKRHGLMVLQGIWIERNASYNTSAFRQAAVQVVQRETTRARAHDNILALIVGNDLQVPVVFAAGIPETEALLRRTVAAVKEVDPQRLVTYANWPALAFLDASPWDLVSFNVYSYEPASVAHSFGYRSYLEHLKQTTAARKPLVVTEVGLSVSNQSRGKSGYGGYTPEAQRTELLRLWDELFQSGVQGGAVFEWNDEWWKQAESSGDEQSHDENDPEEWFGLVEFSGPDDREGTRRPAYDALKHYNQAIILSPVSHKPYADRLQVTVYASDAVASVRYHVGRPTWFTRWTQATRLSGHWWKATESLSRRRVGSVPFVVEAFDAQGRRLVRQERAITIGPPPPPTRVSITTDRDLYEVNAAVRTVEYRVEVSDDAGKPLPNRPVHLAIVEPMAGIDLSRSAVTDAHGRFDGTYLINEPGIVGIAAATPVSGARRVGDERFLVVRRHVGVSHQPSRWEQSLSAPLRAGLAHETPAFELADPGTEPVIDYARYGVFRDAGASTYQYDVRDWEGLAAAAGEGVYPNEASLLRDPAYKQALKAGKLEGSHWDFTFLPDVRLSFFKWAAAEEEPGVKQFHAALTLERAGLWHQAVKAYYAVLVHFPRSVGWTAFDPPTPWYVGKVARSKVEAILRLHPELGLRLEDAQVTIQNGFDNAIDNDTILAQPGRLVRVPSDQVSPPSVDVAALGKTREVGTGRVRLVKYANGHWQLLVDGRPWTVQGLTYKPTAVGETPDEGPLPDWMTTDRNANGTLDVLESFVDANRNHRQDADEPTVGDFALIRDMGVNTLRLYHTDHKPAVAKTILRRLHADHGFMVMMGDFVGMYTIGSGAKWEAGTDYLDKAQRQRMFEGVKAMVKEYKDEPYLLMWVLGNENNYGGVHGIIGGVGNAGQHPHEYYRFLNEIATWIHAEDPHHPVAIGNGDALFLDIIAKEAPAIDIFGANAYRGWQGVGRSFFEDVRQWLDKPTLITEYGCPAYQRDVSRDRAELDQAMYHFGNWVDIADNLAGRGAGNALGGIIFEWSDEWWKAGQPPRFSPTVQETVPNWAGPYPGGFMFEEWLGLVTQGDGSVSPFLRQLRRSYELYQQLWNGDGAGQSQGRSP